jgi:hypothetical protein
MRVLLLPSVCRQNQTTLSHATWWVVHFGILLFLVPVGCSTTPRPGVTCNVSIITQGSDGEITPQGSMTRIASAAVNTETKITHEGSTFSVLVRKTEYGKVTLDLTFPGLEPQRVRINAGETKDVIPEGQKVGLRIDVQECH